MIYSRGGGTVCSDLSGAKMGCYLPPSPPHTGKLDAFPGEESVQQLPGGDPGHSYTCRPGLLSQSLNLPLCKVGVVTPEKARLRGQPQAGLPVGTGASQA